MHTLNFTYSNDAYYISNSIADLKTEFIFHKIIDLQTRSTIYYELQSQLIYQSGENHESVDFFKIVDNQFIKRLSLNQLKYVRRKTLPHPPTINLTLSCLEDNYFIRNLLHFSDLKFALEITDIDVEIDNPQLKRHLNTLKTTGIKLWLDNYCPENKKANATLGEIAWDSIKVDLSAIPEHHVKPNRLSSLLSALTPFATDGIVFDGIETKQEELAVSNLKACGQGYFYHYPKKWTLIMQEHRQRNPSIHYDRYALFEERNAHLEI